MSDRGSLLLSTQRTAFMKRGSRTSPKEFLVRRATVAYFNRLDNAIVSGHRGMCRRCVMDQATTCAAASMFGAVTREYPAGALIGQSWCAEWRRLMSKHRVLMTGASKGIGRAVAGRLAASEFEVIGVARSEASDFPGQFYEVDLGDREATGVMLEKIVADGRVDAVVNNVSLQRFSYIGSVDLDELFEAYDMNVRVAVQVVQALLPGMIDAG
jgi:hypothetical protein